MGLGMERRRLTLVNYANSLTAWNLSFSRLRNGNIQPEVCQANN